MLHPGGKVTPLVMALLGVVCLAVQDLGAERRTIIMGGADGLAWADGGGAIAATVQTGPNEVETSNTPSNVIEFDAGARVGWLSPQQADETINIALGLLDRGGRLGAPTILSRDIKAGLVFMVDDDPARTEEVVEVDFSGIYICRVEAETEEGRRQRSGVVSVAY